MNHSRRRTRRLFRRLRRTLLLFGVTALAGCTHHAAPVVVDAGYPRPATRPAATTQSAQPTLETPEAAMLALAEASAAPGGEALTRLLGPDAQDIFFSGDPVADQNGRQWFASSFAEAHDLTINADGSRTIELGAQHWPMPIPIVQDRVQAAGPERGRWHFDTAAGRDEILNRRIGRNELAAMQVCRAIVDAQQEYAMADPDHDGVPAYAERFASRAGKKDGLYWPATPVDPPSPLGELFSSAADDGYSTTQSALGPRRPYHGYFYRMLKRQGPGAVGGARDYRVGNHMIGGFGVIAFPADYGNSGVMTFIVNQDGVIYQRNFGQNTDFIARAMFDFDPAGWTRCDTPDAKN